MKGINTEITDEQRARFQTHMKRIPGDELLGYAESKTTKRIMKKYGVFEKHPLFLLFYQYRNFAEILGQALKAKLKSDKNPLALQYEEKLTEEGRSTINVLVDFYQNFFYLSQEAWGDIKLMLDESFYLYIQDEMQLLAMVIHEMIESHYESCVDGYSYTHRELEEEARELKDILLKDMPDNDDPAEYSPYENWIKWTENSLLLRLPPFIPEYGEKLPTKFLLQNVIVTCEIAAQKNSRVRNRVRNLRYFSSRLVGHQAEIARKARLNGESMSIKRRDGLFYKGCKGGWVQDC